QRQAQQQAMPGEAYLLRAQREASAERGNDDGEQEQPAPRLDEVAERDQRARRQRQLLVHLHEYADDLRHDVGEQAADDQDGDDREQQRIGERGPDLLLQRVARLAVVGQPRQHLIEPAGLLTGGDRGAIDFGKAVRRLVQRGRQAGALHDARAQRDDQRARARVVVLLGERGERLVDRQTGLEQRRQLAR